MQDLLKIQKETLLCYQCSACNSVCPAFRIEEFSPRNFILKLNAEGIDSVAKDKSIWACKTCGICEICPMKINIPMMVIQARTKALKLENLPPPTKNGHRRIFTLAQKIQANGSRTPNSLSWPRKNQKYGENGKFLLFTGILPIWDSLLYSYDLDLKLGLQAVLEALNSVDIIPAIPRGLKDSGHDLYHGGDDETFLKLANYNQKVFEQAGSETIIVLNPEDFHMLKNIYPLYLEDFDHDVRYWTDILLENGFIEHLRRQAYLDVELKVCYHDPCKLGRMNKIYDSPRIILKNIPGVKLLEMQNERDLAPCCGVSAFIGCDEGSLFLRLERLEEARETGCDVFVSTCPSCISHYSCANSSVQYKNEKNNETRNMKVMELSVLMAKKLYKFGPL
ncbi:MAG: (Fe-S)-binding protein [Promethearchaeota archaeon]